MSLYITIRRHVGGLLRRSVGRETDAFLDICKDPLAQQEVLLKRRIAEVAGSQFDRDTGVSKVGSVGELRRQLPLFDYDDLHPYIERVTRGEKQALFAPGTDVLMFALTSGTTGTPKHIPVTRDYIESYRRSWRIWGLGIYQRWPVAYDGKMLQVVSTPCEWTTPAGHPCGAVSGYTAKLQPYIIRMNYAAPTAVGGIADYAARYYTLMRIALKRDITMITTPNPMTVLKLVELARDRSEDLIRDVHDGTLAVAEAVPAEVRKALARSLKASRRRAGKLEAMRRSRGELWPRDYWPNLQVLGNWCGGSMGQFLPRYEPLFGPVPVRELGLLASEGRLSIPLADDDACGPLDVMHHIFEFVPAGTADGAAPNDRQAATLGIDEVVEGGEYSLVMTSPGGLFRYQIHDHVRVEGFVHRAPVIRFLNKGAHFSSLCGEKLSEYQVVEAGRAAAAEAGVAMDWFVLVPAWGDPPCYRLMMEDGTVDAQTATGGQGAGSAAGDGQHGHDKLLERMDAHLCRLNCEYQSRRSSQRLGPVQLAPVAAGTFDRLRARRSRSGNEEQYKHQYLTNDPEYLKDRLKGRPC